MCFSPPGLVGWEGEGEWEEGQRRGKKGGRGRSQGEEDGDQEGERGVGLEAEEEAGLEEKEEKRERRDMGGISFGQEGSDYCIYANK